MKLRVDFGDEASGEWKSAAILDPDATSTHSAGSFTWDADISFPSGETIQVGAVYGLSNRSVNIVVKQAGKQLISVFGFKLEESTYDPSVLFLSPGGLHVHVSLGI